MAQVVGVEAEIGALRFTDAKRDVELPNAIDRIETAHMPNAVLVHHARPDGIVRVATDGLLEVVGQVRVDKLDHVDFARMSRSRIANIKIVRVARACELNQDVFRRVVLMVAPVAAAFAPPVAPVHGSIVALHLDTIQVALDEKVLRPAVVGLHALTPRRGNRTPDSGSDGAGRSGRGDERRVGV